MASKTAEESTPQGTQTLSQTSNCRSQSNVNTETNTEEDTAKKGRPNERKAHEQIRTLGVQNDSSNKKCISVDDSPSSQIPKSQQEYNITTQYSMYKVKHMGTTRTLHNGGGHIQEEPPAHDKDSFLSDTLQPSEAVGKSEGEDYQKPTANLMNSIVELHEPEWEGVHGESQQPVRGIPNRKLENKRDEDAELNREKTKATVTTNNGDVAQSAAATDSDSATSSHLVTNRESNTPPTYADITSYTPSEGLHSPRKAAIKHAQHETGDQECSQSRGVCQKEGSTPDVHHTEKLNEGFIYGHACVTQDNDLNVELIVGTLRAGGCAFGNSEVELRATFNDSEKEYDTSSNSFELNHDKQLIDSKHDVSPSATKRLLRISKHVSCMSDGCDTSANGCDCLEATETDNSIKIRQSGPNSSEMTNETTHSSGNISAFESSYCNDQSSSAVNYKSILKDEKRECTPLVHLTDHATSDVYLESSEDMTGHPSVGNSSTPNSRRDVTYSPMNNSDYRHKEHCREHTYYSPFDASSLGHLGSDYVRFETTDISYDVLSDLDSMAADGLELDPFEDGFVVDGSDCDIQGILDDQRTEIGGTTPAHGFIGKDSMLSSTRPEMNVRTNGRLPTVIKTGSSDACGVDGQTGSWEVASFTHSLETVGCVRDQVSLLHISPIGVCSGAAQGLTPELRRRRCQEDLFDARELGSCSRKDLPSSCLARAMTRGWNIGSMFPVDDIFLYHNESAASVELDSSLFDPESDESKFDESGDSFVFEVLGPSPEASTRNRIRGRFEYPLSCERPMLTRLFSCRDPTLPMSQTSPTALSRSHTSPTAFLNKMTNRSYPLASSTPRKTHGSLRRRSSPKVNKMEDFSVQDTVDLFLTMTSPLKTGRTFFS